MNFISVDNLSKSYGDKTLFENISFGIGKGQKTALVAKNGQGKTTLLKIIMKQEIADEGKVAINKDISIGFLEQSPAFDEKDTVTEYIFRSDTPILRAIKNYEELIEKSIEDTSKEIIDTLQKATSKMDDLSAWDYENKVNTVLSMLKVTKLGKSIKELSGGQRKRVALARVLIEEPDLLIMDEPTNHLDLDMIEWLEKYLSRQNLSLLLVTHDRYFLDNICNQILELDDDEIYKHHGNYFFYVNKRAERELNVVAATEKAKNLLKKELEWMRRMPKARTTKSKSRIGAFYDLEKKATKKNIDQGMQLDMQMSRMGKKILELKNVNKSYGDLRILKDFNYIFKRKERIGIVGKNGVGKSTFLNIITHKEKADSGQIDKGETIVYGYYTQLGLKLDEDKRVIEVVRDIAEVIPQPDGSQLSPIQFLQLFNFPPKQQHAYVSTLSGGEKRRLYLLTILIKNPNFLILDEPTNDLDLDTLNTLEMFLSNYQGCVLVVTHDRYFMDKVVDHIFVFEGNGIISDFNGNYQDYRLVAIEREKEVKALEKADKEKKQTPIRVISQKVKMSYKEQIEYKQLETDIETLESEKSSLEQRLNNGILDHGKLLEISNRIGELTNNIDEKSIRWLELSELE